MTYTVHYEDNPVNIKRAPRRGYRVLAEDHDGRILILEYGILHEHTAVLIAAARSSKPEYRRVYTDRWPV